MNPKSLSLSPLTIAIISGGLFFAGNIVANASPVAMGTQVAASTAASQQINKSPNDQRQYQAITLQNKLDVILVSDPTAEKSSAALSVDVGWLNDPKQQQGLAHFLEHMLFMGTERFPEPDGYLKFMEQHGGSTNAFTNQLTNYMFEINNNKYEEALDRFADFFKAPLLLAEYVDKERNAVNSEWSLNNNKDGWAQQQLAAQLLGAHPANQFWIGNLDTLSDKTDSKLHEELVAFYQQYYSANRMKLVLISPQPLPQMQLLAQRYFAGIKNKNVESPRPTANIDFSQFGPKRVHYVPNTEMQSLQLEFTIDNNLADFGVKPNEFVAHLLSSEMPGTPVQQLKAMGMLDVAGVTYDPKWYGNYGTLKIIMLLTEAGMQQRPAITAIMLQYIDLIRSKGVDAKYYNEIRTSLQNQFNFLEKTDGFSYAAKLSEAMQYYPLPSVISAPYQYDKFDPKAVNALLTQLVPERLTVWHISRNEPAEHNMQHFTGRYSVAAISEQEIQSWQQAAELMYLPYDDKLQISAQDDSFLTKKPWDFAATPADKYPLLLHFHPLVIYRHQVLKQADLVLAMYLLDQQFDRDLKARNLAYYEPLTTHDSSLSSCIHSVAFAETGQTERAYQFFANTARMDLDNYHHNTEYGVHIACMAGSWLSVVCGFAGMRSRPEGLYFEPKLPAAWPQLKFKLNYRGRVLQVHVSQKQVSYQLLSGADLTLQHQTERFSLVAGQSQMFSLSVASSGVKL